MLYAGQEYEISKDDAGDFVKNCFAYFADGPVVHNKSRGRPRKVKQNEYSFPGFDNPAGKRSRGSRGRKKLSKS